LAPRAKDDGRLRLHPRFPSRYLSTARSIAVYLPPGYETSSGRYPVFYLQDGQNLFDPATAFGGNDWRADLTADELIHSGRMEPVILAGIYNAGLRRISEYTPTRDRRSRKGGKAGRNADMLAREIKPFLDQHYRTRRTAADTAVGGSSLGALAALVAGVNYPRIFGKLALLSPSVWWDDHSTLQLVERWMPRQPRPRIWLDTGTAEGRNPARVVEDARLLNEALAAKGWRPGADLYYEEAQGHQHNEQAWGERFGRVLEFLFPPRG